MKLLIVVDKLLTGFDAPPCVGLYLDKPLQDHGLFQAICRVNRPDGEGKDFGYIVDYRQSFGKLADVFNKYTSGAFRDFAAEDVDGLIKNRLAEAKKYLDATLAELEDLFAGVPAPRADMDYLHYFCGADGARGIDDVACSRNRARLYKLTDRLIRAYSEIRDDMDKAGYTAERQAELEKTVAFHAALKETIGKASGDFIGLQPYEAEMCRLLETYIKTDDGRKIGASDTFTLPDFVLAQGGTLGGDGREAAAEAIENNIRKKIVGKILTNPKYYEKMATILDELITARREGAIAGEAMLKKYGELARQIENPENDPRYPKTIRNSQALRAFFDNCGEDEAVAIALDKAVRANREADFRHNGVKERRIKGALARVLNSENEIERVYAIIVEQGEY
jgi:type I restriction enzyme R subunit